MLSHASRMFAADAMAWALGLALMLAAGTDGDVFAGSGSVVALPVGGVKNRSGLRLEADLRWVSGSAYRPVRVRISVQPFGPAPADRTLEVSLRPHGWSGGAKAGAVVGTVEIKQGATFGEAILSVPQTNAWHGVGIETRESGWRHRDLCSENMGMATRFVQHSPDNSPAIVIVHWAADDRTRVLTGGSTGLSTIPAGKLKALYIEPVLVTLPGSLGFVPLLTVGKNLNFPSIGFGMGGMPGVGGMSGVLEQEVSLQCLPDIRVLAGRFPDSYASNYGGTNILEVFSAKTATTDAATLTLVNDLPNIDLLPPQLLPDHWIDLTNVDIIMASWGELRDIQTRFPEKWGALIKWLRTGPTLVVYDAGKEFTRLAEIEQLLLAEPILPVNESEQRWRGWEVPNPSAFKDEISVVQSNSNPSSFQVRANTQQRKKSETPQTQQTSDQPWFVSRPFGSGRVVAIAVENPFPGTASEWTGLFNSLAARHWLTYQRHGVSQFHDNPQFWNFLVEGIGRAPVKTFLGLITLFAIVIGPVNYFLLQRRRRLYLLLVTVPLGSLVVAVGLFLFAVSADGLGNQVRLRSFTELDQVGQQSITWSRQTYYAGFATSRGLTFPAAAAVYPVEHRPVSGMGPEDPSRKLVWGDRQHLAAGYFSSRTMTQFVVVEPQATPAAVRVLESNAGSPPEVTNELGVPIERLVLRDARGDLYQVINLPNGKKSPGVKVTEPGKSGAEWRAIYRAARPDFPPGFDLTALDDVSQFFSVGRWQPPRTTPAPLFETSVLEVGLRDALDRDFAQLALGSYVAVLSRSPFVSLGVETVSRETGFHVVVGRW